jgi:protease-4
MTRGNKYFLIIAVVAVALAFAMGLARRLGGVKFGGPSIALLRVEGPIIDVTWHLEEVKKLTAEDRIKAVVLRIDSPGGAVAPTQELYRELLRLKEHKPVVTSMGTIAASGGYYLSCATDWIICNPGTITGSVGVLMEFTNLKELFRKIGIGSRTIKSGKFKDTGNPARDMSPEEERLMTDMVMDTYEQFVEAVLEGRSLNEEKVRPYFDGRVLTGRQALELGLVDEFGNINDGLAKAAEMAGLPYVPDEIYEPERERPGLIGFLFGEAVSKAVLNLAASVADSTGDRWIQLWRVF